jgi:TolB-like protein/Tfp pilus assembly protein PilF
MSFYNELKRRNVFRVAIAYLAGAWLLTEVAGTLFPAFGIPDWAFRFVIVLFAFGFVPALIFSWAYELTPEGLKRERDVERDESITHLTAKRMDVITIGLIVVALLFIMADRFFLSSRTVKQPAASAVEVIDDVPTPASELTQTANLPHSIAVLPFTNRSASPEDAYFVDGIHDDLLTHISKIGSIKTISRTSVMRYRDTTKTIPEIASELGVSTVLEGGVQRAGQQIRINVQLIDARTDEHLWAEIYDRHLSAENIFAIQSEISSAISVALKAILTPEELERIQAMPTESLEAYEAYLIGKKHLSDRTTESLSMAIDRFNEATQLDPEFSLAWIGLANSRYLHTFYTGKSTADDDHPAVRTALMTALELNPDAGEAYATLGLLELDKEVAERHFRRAIELRPNYANAYIWYSLLLRHEGRIDEALNLLQTAVKLDPMSILVRVNLAVVFRMLGRFDDAWEELHKAIDINPDSMGARDAIATMHYQVFNRHELAVKEYGIMFAARPEVTRWYVWLAQLYLDMNARDRAEKLIGIVNESNPGSSYSAWGNLLLGLQHGSAKSIEDDAQLLLRADGLGPDHWIGQFAAGQLRNIAMQEGRLDDARQVYAKYYPELLSSRDPMINSANYRAAIDLALVLQRTGDSARAEKLLQLCAGYISDLPRLGWWRGYWISDVQILALQGRSAEALDSLWQAIDEGWRVFWWYYLNHEPNLEPILAEPALIATREEIEVEMMAKMQRVREMEDAGEIGLVAGVDSD